MVGVRGFEPPAPWSQTRCANQTALHSETLALWIEIIKNFFFNVKAFKACSKTKSKKIKKIVRT